MSLTFQPIHKSHDRKNFDCGYPPLNLYLQETARRQEGRRISSTTVLVDTNKQVQIIGFYTLVYCTVDIPQQSPLYNKYPHGLHGIRLARMAVDKQFKGLGYGSDMVIQAILKTVHANTAAPLAGLFVDAKDQSAKNFYTRLGFLETQPGAMGMWLTFDQCLTIAKAAH